MREIKFRVYDSQRKIMYGCRSIEWENDGKMKYRKGSGIVMDESLGDKLMQYTGLHDKNGKEIYDGDILAIYSWGKMGEFVGISKVVWDEEEAGWRIQPYHGIEDSYDLILRAIPCSEIIGNIYESPELLEE